MQWTKQFFRLHRILGLVAGSILLLMSITGSLLVFSDEIEHASNQHAYHVTAQANRLPLQQLLENTRHTLPGNPYLFFVKIPHAPNESAILRADYTADHKVYVFLDPFTGKILQQYANTDHLTGYILYLHFTLLSGKTGATIVLITGIALFLSVLTGIFVYRHAMGKVLTFRLKLEWHNRTRRWRNLHRILGVWALLFNAVISFTGFMMEQKVLDARKSTVNGYTSVPFNGNYDQLLPIAQSAIPGFQVVGIRPPKKAGDPARFLGHAHESTFFGEYASSVFLTADGHIKKTVDFSKASLGDRFNASIAPLHFGNYGGIFLKILYSFLALTPGILSISGFLIWYRRKFIIKTHRI
ncbi:putative iron-regulated membrane protein [Chitinophaga polysaccharea]|uniref:Putative iron-regulated membrane protein n=1 Tax=Chitinophaga polysaccharea TaxID=1293035 RepID=A0A561PH20_9BACT|nr:PepSY-associated TM helix domain-containing protein [Chitinophaga polysaccharea]TWF37414.1 putative iron-regulated membrane protein [Chitinophaga polysaccharea]